MGVCLLCNGHGSRLIYTLRRMRRTVYGAVLKLAAEPISAEEYRELSKRLPTSPVDWTPEHEGVLSVESCACVCRPPAPKRKEKRSPARPAPKRRHGDREPWWNR